MKEDIKDKSFSRVFPTQIRVIYADTDHGGVAYYASYMRWFEIGRTELLRSIGLIYAELEKSGILCPVVDLQCRYIKPARYDELLVVYTSVERLRRGSITFAYNIKRKSDQALIATGKTQNAFVNRALKCTRPPKEIYRKLQELAGEE